MNEKYDILSIMTFFVKITFYNSASHFKQSMSGWLDMTEWQHSVRRQMYTLTLLVVTSAIEIWLPAWSPMMDNLTRYTKWYPIQWLKTRVFCLLKYTCITGWNLGDNSRVFPGPNPRGREFHWDTIIHVSSPSSSTGIQCHINQFCLLGCVMYTGCM